MRMFAALGRKTHNRSHGVPPADFNEATWRKSTFSSMNGSCVEVSWLQADRIGVRDTKDHGTGPVLVFTGPEWTAFLAGAKEGQFDNP